MHSLVWLCQSCRRIHNLRGNFPIRRTQFQIPSSRSPNAQKRKLTVNSNAMQIRMNDIDLINYAPSDNRQEKFSFPSIRRSINVRCESWHMGTGRNAEKSNRQQDVSPESFTEKIMFSWFHRNKLNFKTLKLNTDTISIFDKLQPSDRTHGNTRIQLAANEDDDVRPKPFMFVLESCCHMIAWIFFHLRLAAPVDGSGAHIRMRP